MHSCPHCKKPGITSVQKLCSVSFAPAACHICNKYSYLHVVHGLHAMITWVILTWVFIGVALLQQKSFYLIGTIPAMMLAVDKFMLSAPLRCAHV